MLSDTLPTAELDAQAADAGLKYQTSISAGLLDCRKQYADLEIGRERELHTHNDRLYNLAARIFCLAAPLSDQVAWREFVDSSDWGDRKRPKSRDQAKALRHAVRFVLPCNASGQICSYWGIALEVLRDEGVPATQIHSALGERGGFQKICKATMRTRRPATTDKPIKLFKRPPSALPPILRDAIVVTGEDGKNRIEDGQHRVLVFLAVPDRLMSRIQPGEVHISAVAGAEDAFVLDATGIDVEVPVTLIHLRKNPQDADRTDTHYPEGRPTQH